MMPDDGGRLVSNRFLKFNDPMHFVSSRSRRSLHQQGGRGRSQNVAGGVTGSNTINQLGDFFDHSVKMRN